MTLRGSQTLAQLAADYGYGVGWREVWMAPENALLRARRAVPEKLQPGDRVFVPMKGK